MMTSNRPHRANSGHHRGTSGHHGVTSGPDRAAPSSTGYKQVASGPRHVASGPAFSPCGLTSGSYGLTFRSCGLTSGRRELVPDSRRLVPGPRGLTSSPKRLTPGSRGIGSGRRQLTSGWPTRYLLYVLVHVALLGGLPSHVTAEKFKFKIGLLAPWNATYDGFSALTSASAVSIAIENINADPTINDDIEMTVITMDTNCNSKMATGNAVKMYIEHKVDIFIGPPCSEACRPVAQLASFWNKPIISWVAANPDFLDSVTYSTMGRTLGPFMKIGVFIVEILQEYKWSRVAVINSNYLAWFDASKAIRKAFAMSNVTIAYSNAYLRHPKQNWIRHTLKKTMEEARIVVLICPRNERRAFMLMAYQLGMTTGDYVFITMDMMPQEDVDRDMIWRMGDSRDWMARQAFQSVFHVVLAKLKNTKIDDFRKEVAQRMRIAPWDKYIETLAAVSLSKLENDVYYGDRFAAFLHDAIYLYALAINDSIAQGLDPYNGETIRENMKYKRFWGMTGGVILDNNADREPDYWLMDMAANGTFLKIAEITNDEQVIDEVSSTAYRKFLPRVRPPRWPGGLTGWDNSPPDTPECGFRDELCIDKVEGWVLAVSVIIPMFGIVLVIIITFLAYRKFQFEQSLKEQLWRIKWDDIEPLKTGKISGSNIDSASASRSDTQGSITVDSVNEMGTKLIQSPNHLQSMPSVGTGTVQLFSTVGLYKGTVVSTKNIRKEHIQLTRSLMMEFNEIKDISHENLNIFVGACIDPPNLNLVWTYCSKGSLSDVLQNDAVKLDTTFRFSFMTDIAKGMLYIHNSHLISHGNLKSSNCLIDSRWTVRITDYGLPTFLAGQNLDLTEHELYKRKLWTAPEILCENVPSQRGTQKGDVYSYAIICYEILQRSEPYVLDNVTPRDIVNRVRNGESIPFRPPLPDQNDMGQSILLLIKKCWSENSEERPKFMQIRQYLRKMTGGDINIIDNVLKMMERYAVNLEDIVEDRTSQLMEEKKKTDKLLCRMLPPTVAESLKSGMMVQPENFECCSLYFSDIVGFTNIASDSSPMQIVDFLNDLYSCFDSIIELHDVYKVETIGDAYLVVSGVPVVNGTRHSAEIANCALQLLSSVTQFTIRHRPKQQLQLRIGLHSGPVVAGVVGVVMPRYCLFGDTVNHAARMESHGKPLGIHISKQFYNTLKDNNKEIRYHMKMRGEVNIKGKGLQTTYWLLGRDGFDMPLPALDIMLGIETPSTKKEDPAALVRNDNSMPDVV